MESVESDKAQTPFDNNFLSIIDKAKLNFIFERKNNIAKRRMLRQMFKITKKR